MSSARQVLMEVLGRPLRSLLMFLASLIFAVFCMFGCFLSAVSANFNNVFREVSGYSIGVMIKNYTTMEDWEPVLAQIMENPHIVSYNTEDEWWVLCEPVDFTAVYHRDGTVSMDGEAEVWLGGYMDVSYVSRFKKGSYALVSGSYPSLDNPGVLMEQTLAEENGLKVGDSITVAYDENTIILKVLGIYEIIMETQSNSVSQSQTDFTLQSQTDSTSETQSDSDVEMHEDKLLKTAGEENEILLYCDAASLSELTMEPMGSEVFHFYVDDYDAMPECISYVKGIVSELDTRTSVSEVVDVDSGVMSAIFVSLNRMNMLVLGATYALCAVISAIMVILWMRTHKGMIAIYRTLGQSNAKLTGLLLCEVLAVTAPGLLLAVILGSIFININANTLIQMVLDWSGLNQTQQSYALENWNPSLFTMNGGQILLEIGALELLILAVTVIFAVHFVRLPVRKLRE